MHLIGLDRPLQHIIVEKSEDETKLLEAEKGPPKKKGKKTTKIRRNP